MAEIKNCRVLQANNGCRAHFVTKTSDCSNPDDSGGYLWFTGRWPLDEYDELDKFVREHQVALAADEQANIMKLSELEASNE